MNNNTKTAEQLDLCFILRLALSRLQNRVINELLLTI